MRNLSRLALEGRRYKGGFTLVELLVVIGIIAILAGVALGPITNGIKKAQESGAMQTTRTIALAEFQFANDNNSTYPDGASADIICKALMSGNYVSDPNIFFLSSDKLGATKPTSVSSFVVGNDSFDFMGSGSGTATNGVGATAPDQLPLVWSEGESSTDTVPAANNGTYFAPSAGVFGKDGVAVCYHSNNAFFRAPAPSTATTKPAPGQITFIDQSFDPSGVTYAVRVGASGS
jgi:prepilin-type N-terminal cleavage/methylation domain-containing protein